MKDEIKEILKDIKEIYYFKPLLDYITNLQKERDFYKCTDSMNMESNIELRGRIDKAIEYIEEIKKAYDITNDFLGSGFDNLLNILQGSDKE